jgi:alanine dehydrogenase
LGQLRTGAVTALAVKKLFGDAPERLAVIGCGWQAESQVESIYRSVGFQQALVYCRTAERRQTFAQRMGQRLGRSIFAVDTVAEAVADAEVVVTITTSLTAVVTPQDLYACKLLVLAGSNSDRRSEVEPTVIANAKRIVCDDVAGCQREAGELIVAAQRGVFRFDQAIGLERYCTEAPPPPPAEGMQIFKTVGTGAADVAIADLVYRRALAEGRGTSLPF